MILLQMIIFNDHVGWQFLGNEHIFNNPKNYHYKLSVCVFCIEIFSFN